MSPNEFGGSDWFDESELEMRRWTLSARRALMVRRSAALLLVHTVAGNGDGLKAAFDDAVDALNASPGLATDVPAHPAVLFATADRLLREVLDLVHVYGEGLEWMTERLRDEVLSITAAIEDES